MLKALSPGDHVLLLDERGREVSSEDIARIIAQAGDNGSPLAFVVGGPFGHGPAVVNRANDSIRLSKMVLNHQVRVELLLAGPFTSQPQYCLYCQFDLITCLVVKLAIQ